jgi:PAS domain S-box-containing protein
MRGIMVAAKCRKAIIERCPMTSDGNMTKAQLLDEIQALRQRVHELDGRPDEKPRGYDRGFSQTLLSIVGALVIVLDRKGRIAQFNRACETATGYSLGEVQGRCFWDFLVVPEEIEPVKVAFDDLRSGMFPNTHQNYWITKEGALRWIAWSNTCLVDKNGDVEFVVGTGLDLTERKRMDAELQAARDELEAKVEARTAELSSIVAQLQERISERKRAEERALHFSRVLERSLNEIYTFDVETLNFVEVNRGAQENLGYTMDELRGLTPVDLKPEYTPEMFAALVEPLRTGKQEKVDFITAHQRKDGTQYPVEVHLQLIIGPTPFFVAIILDITERRRSEEAVRESESSLKAVVEGVQTAIVVHDSRGRIVLSNQTARRLLEPLTMDIDGRGLSDPAWCLFYEDGREVPREEYPVSRILETGEAIEGLLLGVGDPEADKTRWILVNAVPVIDGSGHPTRIIVSFVDITDRKEAERAMQEQTRELVKMHQRVEVRNAELQKALDEIATLRGIVPICSFCKKVRDDEGYWQQVDTYIRDHTEAEISHGICPDCFKEQYPGFL